MPTFNDLLNWSGNARRLIKDLGPHGEIVQKEFESRMVKLLLAICEEQRIDKEAFGAIPWDTKLELASSQLFSQIKIWFTNEYTRTAANAVVPGLLDDKPPIDERQN